MTFKELFEKKSSFCKAHCWKRFSVCLADKAADHCSGPRALCPTALRSSCHSCWEKKWLQPLNLERATGSDMCSSTSSLPLLLAQLLWAQKNKCMRDYPHLLSRSWGLSALSNEAVMSFHLPVPMCLDKRAAQPCAVSVCYALVGNPSHSVIFVFHRLINVLNQIS